MVFDYIKVDYTDKLFKAITDLRQRAFCDEGGEKPSYKKDERDEKATHVAMVLDGIVLACGSVFDKGNGDFELYKIAVSKDYRRFGIGSRVLKELKKHAKEQGAKRLVAELPAECLDFFHKNGVPHSGITYKKEGKSYIKCEENLVFDDAKWVEFDGETQAVIVKGEFNASKKEETFLYATGLGYCHIYVNGKPVSDRVLAPAWTNYAQMDTVGMSYPIFDKMTYRILYEKIDITRLIKKGRNTITFHIGGGWYSQRECPNEGVKPYGSLLLCYKVSQGENIISKSDEALKWRKSFVTRASVYYGEDQDARLGDYDFSQDFCTDGWKNVDIAKRPLAVLNEQDCIPDKITRTLTPKCIYRKGSYAIYDIGENVAGYPVVEFSEEAWNGETCTMRFAEVLNSDGSLNFRSTGGEFRAQKDTFIYHSECKEYYPRFTWHGGRYFDVLGRVNVKAYNVVHTDIKPKIEFKSSNETIQWIYDAFVRTQQMNTHGNIPSDCPHRERLGYTGDGQLTADSVMTVFDAEKMYRKWIRDIADSQDIYNGHVQHTAPFYGGGGGPGGWGGAMVFVVYSFYKHYGDKNIVKEYYNNMLSYLDYMENHSEKGIVVREEVGGWCLGDWCAPGNNNRVPIPLVNTYFYIRAIRQVIELSKEIDKSTKDLEARLKKVEKAFLDKYYDKKTSTFAKSLESSDAYGYDLGFGNEKTLKKIVEKYEKLGQFDTGIFGTRILIKILCENGHKDLAFKLLSSEKENSFYNMKKQGATTLWENWDGCDSHSHPMFGGVVEYIVKYFNEI